jgi:hypothetical protein
MAGMMAARAGGRDWQPPPRTTALGALLAHITGDAEADSYQPMNVNFGLFPPLHDVKKKQRKEAYTARAKADPGRDTRLAPGEPRPQGGKQRSGPVEQLGAVPLQRATGKHQHDAERPQDARQALADRLYCHHKAPGGDRFILGPKVSGEVGQRPFPGGSGGSGLASGRRKRLPRQRPSLGELFNGRHGQVFSQQRLPAIDQRNEGLRSAGPITQGLQQRLAGGPGCRIFAKPVPPPRQLYLGNDRLPALAQDCGEAIIQHQQGHNLPACVSWRIGQCQALGERQRGRIKFGHRIAAFGCKGAGGQVS